MMRLHVIISTAVLLDYSNGNRVIQTYPDYTRLDRLQNKVQHYVRGADQQMLEHMRLTVFEVVVGVLRSKDFRGDIPKAVETACKVCPSSLTCAHQAQDVQATTVSLACLIKSSC